MPWYRTIKSGFNVPKKQDFYIILGSIAIAGLIITYFAIAS